jgi:hypothetical protein
MAESSGEAVLEKLKRGSDSTRGDGDMAPNIGLAYTASAALTWTSRSTGNDAACLCRGAQLRARARRPLNMDASEQGSDGASEQGSGSAGEQESGGADRAAER